MHPCICVTHSPIKRFIYPVTREDKKTKDAFYRKNCATEQLHEVSLKVHEAFNTIKIAQLNIEIVFFVIENRQARLVLVYVSINLKPILGE